jgi:hypothetical protein
MHDAAMIRWPLALSILECEQSGDDRRDLLLQAKDKLERVTRHERWGCSAMSYSWDAAELLRRAGRDDLAAECEDEFGVDCASVIAAIDREFDAPLGSACP